MPDSNESRVKAVLFDLDDTLFDHRHASRTSLAELQLIYDVFGAVSLDALEVVHRRLLEELHLDMLAGKWTLAEARAERYRLLFQEHGHEATKDDIDKIVATARAVYVANRQVVVGTLELLHRLRAEGIKIGIVTNNFVAEQVEKLEVLGLTELIDVMVTAEEARVTKPNPLLFQLALDRLQVSAEEAAMVGDSWQSDVVGAWEAGIRRIFWLNRYDEECPDPKMATEIGLLEQKLLG